MDLTTLRQVAKGQYGLEKSATADALFTDSVLTDMVNAAHMEFAAVTRCYYAETLTFNTVIGQVSYALSPAVIEVDLATVRANLGPYKKLAYKLRRSLVEANGPPETWVNGSPTNFFVRPGAAAGQAKMMDLYPPPLNIVAVNYDAWVYPAVLTADGDTPVLEASEHYRLIPWVCWKMACLEASRGRADAPVALWTGLKDAEGLALREIFRRGMKENARTAGFMVTSPAA